MRILIAEDNRFFRRLIEVNLKQWGHEVVSCEDGACAWELLNKEDAPKLAILDWDMPGMQGTDICRELRKLSDRPVHLYYNAYCQERQRRTRARSGLRGRRLRDQAL